MIFMVNLTIFDQFLYLERTSLKNMAESDDLQYVELRESLENLNANHYELEIPNRNDTFPSDSKEITMFLAGSISNFQSKVTT